ncbi:hypothetical protein IU403_00420 [Aerococcaceae bacterium zg-BR22]|uniref:exonuclease domain-containing protein n=1 Tax=Aerococcaceae bacterium zg-1292 TaxID=2774330 RepID=UPI004063053D|nr:hypothetical protein [Aerococcaceae bacterium zg-BR22]
MASFQEFFPGYSVKSFITNLTGITNEILENTRKRAEVLKDFVDCISNSTVIAHNAYFDINFL